MNNVRKFSALFLRLLSVLVVVCILFQPVFVHAEGLTKAQRSALARGARYVNTEIACSTGTGTTSGEITGGSNQEIAFKDLVARGLSPEQAAGIVGNLMQESSGGKDLDPLATNGTHTGIAQWDNADRYQKLKDWATLNKKDHTLFRTQLDYLWVDMTTNLPDMLTRIKAMTKIDDVVVEFEKSFERSGGSAMKERKDYANKAFELFGSGTATGTVTGELGINGSNYPNVLFKYGNGPRLSTGLKAGGNVTQEDAAKLLLKFVAVGAGKNEGDVITDEKVLAVVGWMMAEGGSTTTKGSYNTLNNAKDGILDDLQPVYNHVYADGNKHPAFKTLEQGIESNVRFIEKAHYSRLQAMLLDPAMTADNFVANFDNKTYNGASGQLTWAAGGYLTLFQSIVDGMQSNPDSKTRNYAKPVLGDKAKQALRDMGITPDDNVTPLDIDATTTGFSANGCAGSASGSLPSGTAQELAQQILDSPNVKSVNRDQLENIAAGKGPCPTVNGGAYTIDERLLQVIAGLAVNNTFSIASLHRGCTGSTVGSGTKSRHWAGKAVDISGSSGVNGTTMPSFGDYNAVVSKFIQDAAKIFPEGDYGLGVANDRYVADVTPILNKGGSVFLDTPGTTGATGPHVHIQVPR